MHRQCPENYGLIDCTLGQRESKSNKMIDAANGTTSKVTKCLPDANR
jgi:hypothetical protein